ncbi:hypothetical protein [Methanococcoides sp. AM1]|uniref:hypothetical protein n=1 Tax=Methanococcoides sp. AM1 TaxID=1201011 RepID=UPI0010847A6E|nr:hypothetical protein [Methanococcoides sp. AM1]
MRRRIHTTISEESLRYLERVSGELKLSKGEMIDWLVQQHKKHESELEGSILKEVTNQVLTDYYKRELAV